MNNKVCYIPSPKYKEIIVAHLWKFIKEVDELYVYFPDYSESELPEREFLWIIISTLKSDETKAIINQAREQRSQKASDNSDNLIEVAPEILEKIKLVASQQSKLIITEFWWHYSTLWKSSFYAEEVKQAS